MAFVEWSDSYSVGIKKIDEQHKKLIQLLNKLYDAMSVGKGKSVMGDVFKELLDYTVYHFNSEEELFDKYQYPGVDEHKHEHKSLTDKAKDLYEKYTKGSITITIELMNFLKGWVANHILETDKKYTAFLNSKGVF